MNSADTMRYRRTLKGRLCFAYTLASRRVRGKTGRPDYTGLPISPREDWYQAFLNDLEYVRVFKRWARNGFSRFYTPTPDRIDPARGYVVENLRWLPFHENTTRRSSSA